MEMKLVLMLVCGGDGGLEVDDEVVVMAVSARQERSVWWVLVCV